MAEQTTLNGLNLEFLKAHVRAADFDDDDTILEFYLKAAKKHVLRYTRRTEEELCEEGSDLWPEDLQMGVLLMAAHIYDHPNEDVPQVYFAFVYPYVKLSMDKADESGEA